MIEFARLFLTILATIFNTLYDAPHEPESRPDFIEVCGGYDGASMVFWGRVDSPTGSFTGWINQDTSVPSNDDNVYDIGPTNDPAAVVYGALWLERASSTSSVCDRTGTIVVELFVPYATQ